MSAPCLLRFLLCSNLSVSALFSWWALACLDSFHVLTYLSICTLQLVSASCLLEFLPCLNLFLHFLGSEHPLLVQIPSVSQPVYLSIYTLQEVSAPWLLVFLSCSDLFSFCTFQFVSASCILGFILHPNLSIYLHSPECECSSFIHFLCPYFFHLYQRHHSPSWNHSLPKYCYYSTGLFLFY